MHDSEDEQHAILGYDVVHDSVLTDSQSMERIANALDRLHRLATDAARSRGL